MTQQLPQALASFREEIVQATVGSGYFIPAWLIIQSEYFDARLTALLCEFELKGDFICTYEQDIYLFTRTDKGFNITYCDRPHCLFFSSAKAKKATKTKLQELRDNYPEIEWIYVNHLTTPFMRVFQTKLDEIVRNT